MHYRFLPLTFRDVARILTDTSKARPDLHARLECQPVSLLWWVVDERSDSYLLAFDGHLEFEGSGFLFYFCGDFFELKVELFGNRVAFYNQPITSSSVILEIQAAFAQAITVYGRNGEGHRAPVEPVVPNFVRSSSCIQRL